MRNETNDQQAFAWTEIHEHVKILYMTHFGAQEWYKLAVTCNTGIDVVKVAVTRLANK